MFLIICLHGSRRADFLSFSPYTSCAHGMIARVRLRINVLGVFRAFHRPGLADHRLYHLPPAVLRRTKRKFGVTTPEFPLDHTPLSRRRTALRAVPRRPSHEGENPPSHYGRPARVCGRGNASLVIQGFSSRSQVRPRVPWAACRRTWHRSLRCSPRPLSKAPCPR